jgi:tripartite-type tricarboxylate transporter receptor subunit TctC
MLGRMLLGVIAMSVAWPAHAGTSPSETDFFKGKTITVVTSTGVGGPYDLVARLLARFMPRYLPGNPTMVVQDMPGGGNVIAANYMYSIAPEDGTALATIQNSIPLSQALHGPGIRFDARKFNWLGSTGPENQVIVVWRTAGVTTIKQAMENEIVLGATGVGSGLFMIPMAMNNVLGTRFKMVIGYQSSEDICLAMESGEVQARSISMDSIAAGHADWIAQKKVAFIAQAGAKRENDLPDTPLLTELATTEEQKQILQLVSAPAALGFPFLAPPGVPADRLAILQHAFDATLKDADFVAEVGKLEIGVDPMSGEDVAAIVRQTIDAPPDIVAKTKAAVASPDTTNPQAGSAARP